MEYKVLSQPAPSHVRRGFTLLEILLCIGIIALLIGLLLPAIAGVRAQAIQLECSVEMRQLAARVSMYADDSQGSVPLAYTRDREHRGWRAPNGQSLPTGYFATAASFWAYPMLDEYDNNWLNESLLSSNDQVSEQVAEIHAQRSGIQVQDLGIPLTRSISRSFYFSSRSLRQDAVPYSSSREQVGKLTNVSSPSVKALLVEFEPFHDEFSVGSNFVVQAPLPYRRMVVATDLSTQLRSIADAQPAVLLSLDTPAHTPDPEAYLQLQRLISSFDFTRDAIKGRDW